MKEPLGEVGANFPLQLWSRTQLTKTNNKKVIAENQCEKHKKIEFRSVIDIYGYWRSETVTIPMKSGPRL